MSLKCYTANMYKIIVYEAQNGKCPYYAWLSSLSDTHKMRVSVRLERIVCGNFGDSKQIDANIYELRFHFASGYRVYYAVKDKKIVVLLIGGDKSTQSKDIKKAIEYFEDYKENNYET